MKTVSFRVPLEYDNKKVLHFLRGGAGLSSHLVKILKNEQNGILLNGYFTRTIDIIHENDIITINIPDEKSEIEPIFYPLDIIFEDDDILVINKPSGIAMHPTHNHQGDTLANAVMWYYNQIGLKSSFKSIGRLDKETSGVVVLAKNKMAAFSLSGKLEKEYVAIVSGKLTEDGIIDTPIIRPYPNKTIRDTGDFGLKSITEYSVINSTDNYSVVSVRPKTGRTHQIRVHFKSIGHPLLGDDMYGGSTEFISRVALHCMSVKLCDERVFIAEMPEDMQRFL